MRDPSDTPANRPSRPLFDIHVDPPRSPELSLLRLFHRNERSYVTFMRRERPEDANLKTLTQIRVQTLATRGPKRRDLRRDSYFSINGFRSWGTRRTDDLLALNAAAVDLDYHHTTPPLTWQEVVETIESAVSDEIIPAPSLIVNSGQGAWLVWLLAADDDPAQAPTAPTSNRRFLRMINDRLAAIMSANFPQLGSDSASAELTRCLRIPGSVNSKSASYVRFFVHRTPWDAPLTYTLDSLAADIDVDPPSFRREQRSLLVARLPKTATKRGGATNLSHVLKTRLREIETIAEARGGFREGHRNNAALIIAVTLRSLHRSADEISEYLTEFAHRCNPTLSAAAVRGAAAERRYRFTNATIASRLAVTFEEAEKLGLRHIRPDYQPKRPTANNPKGRKEAESIRHHALREIVAELDSQGRSQLPSLRAFVDRLAEEGVGTTIRTVGRDLDNLGIARNHRRGLRKLDKRQLVLSAAR